MRPKMVLISAVEKSNRMELSIILLDVRNPIQMFSTKI